MGALYPRHGASDLRLQSDRTDRTLDVTEAESVIVKDGERLLAFRSERSAIFPIKWELKTQTLVTQAYQRTDL
jgi:hypothetical protein